MATVSSVVRRALRICGVQDADEAVPASDMQDAIETLNAMLADWHYAGIGLPDFSVDGTLDETSDIGDHEAIVYQLAIRIAPEYGATLSPLAMQTASEAMSRLRLRYFQPGTVDFSELPTKTRGFNIVTGE